MAISLYQMLGTKHSKFPTSKLQTIDYVSFVEWLCFVFALFPSNVRPFHSLSHSSARAFEGRGQKWKSYSSVIVLLCVADAVHCYLYSYINRLNWLGRCICASALSHKLLFLLGKTKIIFIYRYSKLNNSVMQIKSCFKYFLRYFHSHKRFFFSFLLFFLSFSVFPFPFPFLSLSQQGQNLKLDKII